MPFRRHVYTDEHEMYREAARRFLAAEAVPYHDEWEQAGETPRSFWLKAGEFGLLCPQVPEAYGGAGGTYRHVNIVTEVAQSLRITGPCFGVHTGIVCDYILRFGTEAQKEKWLPQLVSGHAIGAIAMTEPHAGSDLKAIRTTARRDGDRYTVNVQRRSLRTDGLLTLL